MSDESLDVVIAVYLIPDLAKQDFDGLVKLVEDKTVSTDGVVLVSKNAEGEVHVEETGDHLGRKGVKVGGGVGLVVGLFAPPLLAATAVGAVGLLGWVHRFGHDPDSSQPVTATTPADFAVGAFLVAA